MKRARRATGARRDSVVSVLRTFLWLGVASAMAAAWGAAAEVSPPASAVALQAQTRDQDGRASRTPLRVEPAKTAVVVVDMWDRHWCQTYTARVAALVPRMNRTLAAARKLGFQVVFAPSDVVAFYRDDPRRLAMLAVPSAPEPPEVEFQPSAPPPPTDDCECGPQQPCKAGAKAVWTRQHPDLQITDGDLIADCNNGRELLNLCAHRGLDTLLYMGVASNMCVQFRSMGLRNMKRHGLRAIVVADLVQAITSNGLDASGNKDLNFTPAGGTARVQRHIEQSVAPTIESRQLLTAARMTHRLATGDHTSSSCPRSENTRPSARCRLSPSSTSKATTAVRSWRRPDRRAAGVTMSPDWKRPTTPTCWC